MINEQQKNSDGFEERVNYVCAALERDKEKRSLIQFLGGNIITGDPFSRNIDAQGRCSVEVDTSLLIKELVAHSDKYKGAGRKLCAHFVLSLAIGESLSPNKLLESARYYMKEMGYREGAKWFSVVHYDTDNVHIHIVACRAQIIQNHTPLGDTSPPIGMCIVNSSNSYEKGWQACREIESKFGLQATPNPDESFAKNHDLFKDTVDQGKELRGIIGDIWKEGKPKTFSELVLRLNSKGVLVQVTTQISNPNLIKGINFRLDKQNGCWISGSKLKGSRLTFDKLIKKEGIHYNPSRDNELLGLPPTAYTISKIRHPKNIGNYPSDSLEISLRSYIKIPKSSGALLAYIKNRGRIYGKYTDGTDLYLGFDTRINLKFRTKTRTEVEGEIETQRIVWIVNSLTKILKLALESLFNLACIQVKAVEAVSDLTEPAARIVVPFASDAETYIDQYFEMEDALEAQINTQLFYLARAFPTNLGPTL